MLDTTFVDELASSAPTPGGGGACAYVGALASALASMVGNLTVGKKKYAQVEDEVQAVLVRLENIRTRLLQLVDEDARAFTPLAAAYGMPKDTPEEATAKEAALQKALVGACEVPLEIMRQCALVVDECDFLAHNGSRLVVSDAGVAVVFARAAVQGAGLNVFINAKTMAGVQQAESYRMQVSDLTTRVCNHADAVYEYVLDQIR